MNPAAFAVTVSVALAPSASSAISSAFRNKVNPAGDLKSASSPPPRLKPAGGDDGVRSVTPALTAAKNATLPEWPRAINTLRLR